MLARIKNNGIILDLSYDNDRSIKEGSAIWTGYLNGSWIYLNEKEIEFVSRIDWKKVRTDIALELVKQTPYDAFSRNDYWVDYVFDRANRLTKKLMQDIEE